MHGNAPFSHLTGVPGWETHDEQELFKRLAVSLPDDAPAIVEIGAEFGMSSSIWNKYAPASVPVYSIDLFPGDMLENHRSNLSQIGLLRSQQIKSSSHEAAQTWDKPIALMFIDGDHNYPSVVQDITDWHDFVIPGGYLLFHDCACETNKTPHPLHHDVIRAVDEWFDVAKHEGWVLLETVDTSMVFQYSPKPKAKQPPVQAKRDVPDEVLDDGEATVVSKAKAKKVTVK